MMKRIAEASPRFKARIAGAIFLLGLLSAVFGEFFVRRLEIVADLIAVSSMIAVTLLLYGIFKPVNRGLSLLAASFNLVGLALGALRWNPRGVDIPVVFDGFYCLLIGYFMLNRIYHLAVDAKEYLKNVFGNFFVFKQVLLRGRAFLSCVDSLRIVAQSPDKQCRLRRSTQHHLIS
jgi:hypothetical protein